MPSRWRSCGGGQMRRLPKGTPVAERLEHLSMPVTECGCWIWLGATVPDGYGGIDIGDKKVRAHRASWEAHRGPIPDGMCVLHRCDIPACINPDHLFLGTQLENIADRTKKRRGKNPRKPGESHPNSKLSDEAVRFIRNSDLAQQVLAQRYGVSRPHISLIRSGKRWSHV